MKILKFTFLEEALKSQSLEFEYFQLILLMENQKEIVINLENFMLEVPENDFFVAFEKLFLKMNSL